MILEENSKAIENVFPIANRASANFTNADLENVDFRGEDLRGAKFSAALLLRIVIRKKAFFVAQSCPTAS